LFVIFEEEEDMIPHVNVYLRSL